MQTVRFSLLWNTVVKCRNIYEITPKNRAKMICSNFRRFHRPQAIKRWVDIFNKVIVPFNASDLAMQNYHWLYSKYADIT